MRTPGRRCNICKSCQLHAGHDGPCLLPPDEYIVEAILAETCTERGTYYLIKWEGYCDDENTWEPSQSVAHCKRQIRIWQSSQKKKHAKRSEEQPDAESDATLPTKLKKRKAPTSTSADPDTDAGAEEIQPSSTSLDADDSHQPSKCRRKRPATTVESEPDQLNTVVSSAAIASAEELIMSHTSTATQASLSVGADTLPKSMHGKGSGVASGGTSEIPAPSRTSSTAIDGARSCVVRGSSADGGVDSGAKCGPPAASLSVDPDGSCKSLGAGTHSQCERNPLCTRGFKHGGHGGRCKIVRAADSAGSPKRSPQRRVQDAGTGQATPTALAVAPAAAPTMPHSTALAAIASAPPVKGAENTDKCLLAKSHRGAPPILLDVVSNSVRVSSCSPHAPRPLHPKPSLSTATMIAPCALGRRCLRASHAAAWAKGSTLRMNVACCTAVRAIQSGNQTGGGGISRPGKFTLPLQQISTQAFQQESWR